MLFSHQSKKTIFISFVIVCISCFLSSCMKRNKNSECATGFCPFTLFEKKKKHNYSHSYGTKKKQKTMNSEYSGEPGLSFNDLQKHLP